MSYTKIFIVTDCISTLYISYSRLFYFATGHLSFLLSLTCFFPPTIYSLFVLCILWLCFYFVIFVHLFLLVPLISENVQYLSFCLTYFIYPDAFRVMSSQMARFHSVLWLKFLCVCVCVCVYNSVDLFSFMIYVCQTQSHKESLLCLFLELLFRTSLFSFYN